ncbi:MAG: helix-turn-helix domain-containing protein [Acetobacterium sp.]
MRIDRNKILMIFATKGLNQTKFADMTGMSRGNLSTIVNGKRCKAETVLKISFALGVEVEDLIEE